MRVLEALKNRNDFTTGITPWLAKEFPEAVSVVDQCDYADFVGMLWGACVGSLPESVVDEAVSHIGETLLVLGPAQVLSHGEIPLITFLKSFLNQLDGHSSGSSRFSQISKMISDAQHTTHGGAVVLSSAWPSLRKNDPPLLSVPQHVRTGTDELLKQTEHRHPEKQFSGSTWAGRIVLKWQKDGGGDAPSNSERHIVCLPCVASVILCLQEKNQAMLSQALVDATNIPIEPLRYI